MTYLAPLRLQKAFAAENMTLDIQPDHVVIQGSAQCTEERIRQIALQAGFMSPLISKYKLDGNFVFSRVPFKDADAFFRRAELEELLVHEKYIGHKGENPQMVWAGSNSSRSFVYPALSSCVADIIEQLSKDDRALVEIGSGIGYELSEQIAAKTIRTQPNQDECLMLAQTISDPIYKMRFQDLYGCLHDQGKKIHLIFALNVLDTRSPEEQEEILSQCAQLQSRDDRLVLMLDDNPEFTATLPQVEALNPGTVALPLLPLTTIPERLSFVLVPSECVRDKPTPNDIAQTIKEDAAALVAGRSSPRQTWLHQLQQEKNLKVVVLEDFYRDQVEKKLANAGYASKVHYCASFVPGKLPGGMTTPGDIVFKSVTDTITVRSWEADNQIFKRWLEAKGLELPQFDKEFLSQMRAYGQKILGAEVLVIEATKK